MTAPMPVTLVTGAGSGMGASHARVLARRGHAVACLDRDGDAASSLAVELGADALALTADVTDLGSLDAAVSATVKRFGRVDHLVANAGITVGGQEPTWRMAPEAWQRVLDVNLTGVWLSVRAATPAIRAAGGGCLLLVSSVAGLSASPSWGAYAAAKHGVVGLMRTLANELAEDRIRCNAICPGMVRTPMLYEDARSIGLSDDDADREFVAGHLERRLIEPEEISEVVAFLLSPAGRVVNGQTVVADLGYLARTPGT